jgi:hypothetical protein
MSGEPYLARLNSAGEIADPGPDQISVEMELWFIKQEEAISEPKAIDLSD